MSIKFEGKPPFYLGIAELASAHALDGSVVLRATISVRRPMPPRACPAWGWGRIGRDSRTDVSASR